jgi:hypothetical protein
MLIAALALCAGTVWGQPNRGAPHLGYLYPAGGQQGATFQVTAGGQSLQGARAVYVSGEGVRASVVEYVKPLTPKDLGDVAMHLRALTQQRLAELPGKRPGAAPTPPGQPGAERAELPPLPNHPLLRGLEQKSLQELLDLRNLLFDPKRQLNPQIAETVALEVSIEPNAAPGDREVRLGTPAGLTNPMVFQVGVLPEARELEPNDPKPLTVRPKPVVDLPVLLNGQIMPGDVDRFRFRAQQGQQLVVETQARRFVPYLADAVPGWFQATVALYGPKGNEVAFADDYRFDPDPVLFYEVPETGEYELEVRDAIYRGRDDFVYRIAVGERPFITQVFPLGGPVGVQTVASIAGWNLRSNQLPLDTQPGGDRLRQTVLRQGAWLSNPVTYAVDDLAECQEAEPNDSLAQAQSLTLPQMVNGRIARPDDVDVFRFAGRAGSEVVAEVYARRLQSPLDSLLQLTDASGTVLEWNDDHEDRGSGLLTHHADSYLKARLPQDGAYYVRLSDAEGPGGEDCAYRLRLAPPRPDFALRVSPSSVNLRAGFGAVVWVYALREDGFAGEIGISLQDAPAGVVLSGARIPAGRDSIRMTLTAPRTPTGEPVSLHLAGHAQIGGQTVSHLAVPAEDMMQAFAYRHLVPSQELMVAVTGPRRFAPSIGLADTGPVPIPSGGTAIVRVNAPRGPLFPQIRVELSDPPAGVALQEVTAIPTGLALVLRAQADAPPVGYADNLIVEAYVEAEIKRPDGTATGQKRRLPLGVLPAIPFAVVQG